MDFVTGLWNCLKRSHRSFDNFPTDPSDPENFNPPPSSLTSSQSNNRSMIMLQNELLLMTIHWLLLRSNKASNFAFLDRSHIQRPCSYYWSRKDPPCVHFLLDLASSWPNVQLVTPTLIPSQAISRSFCTAQRCTITQPSLKHTKTHYSPQITAHTAACFKAALHWSTCMLSSAL